MERTAGTSGAEEPCRDQWSAGLPHDLLDHLCTTLLDSRDLAAASGVCRHWRAVAAAEGPWAARRAADFPAADPATLAVLEERLRGEPPSAVYRALARRWGCERCGQEFSNGANTAHACCFHPGILFSGGLMNGEALRFTCCNRRAHHIPNGSRDSNGCSTAFHAGGGSAWQRHGTGVKPRQASATDTGPSCSGRGFSDCGSGGSGRASPSSSWSGSAPGSPPRAGQPLEWHPDQRPGLLELPSRLLSSFGG